MRTNSWEDRTVLGKALRILDAFGPGGGGLTFSDVVERTGYPKATVHRLVRQLEMWGAIEKVDNSLRLGTRLFEIGATVPQLRTLRDAAKPISNRLNARFGHTVTLAVLEGTEVLCLDRVVGRSGVVGNLAVGARGPAHSSALGKIMLAYAGRDGDDAVTQVPLPRYTSATITSSEVFRRELEAVRGNGVAFDREESRAKLACVAAPIHTPCGQMAAMSLSMPSDIDPRPFTSELRLAAQVLSRGLRAPSVA